MKSIGSITLSQKGCNIALHKICITFKAVIKDRLVEAVDHI